MIEDHPRVGEELAALASRKGIAPPSEPSLMQRTALTALRALSGETFDKMYANRMGVSAHEKTVELFQRAASEVEDQDIKTFAAKHLPALEQHLEMARQLQKQATGGVSRLFGENFMDEDLNRLTREELIDEIKKLRQGIRQHRDSSLHELCWHHPALWGLLPDKTDPVPAVPEWPEFMRGCVKYRQSLDEQAPKAPRTNEPYQK